MKKEEIKEILYNPSYYVLTLISVLIIFITKIYYDSSRNISVLTNSTYIISTIFLFIIGFIFIEIINLQFFIGLLRIQKTKNFPYKYWRFIIYSFGYYNYGIFYVLNNILKLKSKKINKIIYYFGWIEILLIIVLMIFLFFAFKKH